MTEMQNIHVGRYSREGAGGVPGVGVDWQGWIEPNDRSWIMFIREDGVPVVFLHRDPETGAILPNDPVEAAAKLALIRKEAARG